MLGVPAGLVPVGLGEPLEQGQGVGAHGPDRGQGEGQGVGVIAEHRGPAVLVVSDEQGVGLGQEVAYPHVGVGLAVGAVDHDLMDRPLPSGGTPLEGLGRHAVQGSLEAVGAFTVAGDPGGAFAGVMCAPEGDVPVTLNMTTVGQG